MFLLRFLTKVFYNIFTNTFLPSASEFELIASHLHIFWLLEFVFQSWNELWINFNKELSHLWHSVFQVLLFVSGELLHFLGPAVNLFKLLAWKDEGWSCEFRWFESHESDIQERNLEDKLSKEEYFFVFENWWDSSEALQESVSWWSCNFKFKFA